MTPDSPAASVSTVSAVPCQRPALRVTLTDLMPAARAGVLHESTGQLLIEYPLTWVGVREYSLRELPGVLDAVTPALAERLRATGVIRVVHLPCMITDDFARSAYGVPCVMSEKHPDLVHVSENMCATVGVLGTSHRKDDESGLMLIAAVISSPGAIRAIHVGGATGSSLAYMSELFEAEDLSEEERQEGSAWEYDLAARPTLANHMIVGVDPSITRGREATAAAMGPMGFLQADVQGTLAPAPCAAILRDMHVTPRVRAALKDLSISIPDDTAEPLRAMLAAFAQALDSALYNAERLEQAVATAQETIAEKTAMAATSEAAMMDLKRARETDARMVAAAKDVLIEAATREAREVVTAAEVEWCEPATKVSSPDEVYRHGASLLGWQADTVSSPAETAAEARGFLFGVRSRRQSVTVTPVAPQAAKVSLFGKRAG